MLSKTIIENILILVGESFWVSSNYAQLHRLMKTKDRRGLSAISQTLNAAANIAWVTYFAAQHLWVPFFTNILMLIMTTMIVGYVLSNRKQFYKGLATIFIIGPLTSYLLIKYPDLSGWIGVSYNAVAATPWVFHVVTTKKTSGISQKALFFALGAMLSTLTYAVLISSWPLKVGCLIGLSYEVIIWRYYYRYRHCR